MAKTKQNPNGIKFQEGDALLSESYSEGPFDLIVAKDVFHCILGKDRTTFLLNIRQSLSGTGKAMLTTHVGLPIHEEVKRYIDTISRENHIRTRVYKDEVDVEFELGLAQLQVIKKIPLPGQLVLYFLK
jgi:hypothetical protein